MRIDTSQATREEQQAGMTDGIELLDVVVLVVYFGGITLAGLWFARRNKGTEEYFLGNRNFPAWAIGLSLVGTSISSVTFIAYPGDAYRTAWLRLLPAFTLPVIIFIAARWILPFFRRGNITSAFEYLEGRFGPGTRVYGAVAFIAAQLVRLSLILFLISELIFQLTGYPYWACIIAAGVFVSFYTIVGGIEAVVWTDVVQTIILIFGGVLCLFVVLRELPGGLGQIFEEAGAAGKFAFAELDTETGTFLPATWDFTFLRKTALMMLLVGLTQWMYEYTCNQNVVQRYCASRTIDHARRSMWICAWTSIPIWTFFMFLGTAFWVLFQHQPTPETEAMLTGAAKPEGILPYFVIHYLPAGITGLVIAAILAAAMSSLDSSINAIATVGIVDIYRRHLVKDRDDKHYLNAARWIAVAASLFMIVGATILAYSDTKTILDVTQVLTAITAGGLLGLFLLGMLTRIGDGRAVALGIVLTIAFTLYRSLEGFDLVPKLGVDQYYTGILGHILMFVVGYIMASVFSPRPRDLTGLTVWTQDKSLIH